MTPVRRVDADEVSDVTIEVPHRRNALSRTVLTGLRDAVRAAPLDGALGIVLAGTEGVFSAGADFAELSGTSEDTAYDAEVAAVVEAIRSCPLPVVVAIEGPCMGAAVDLALACDVLIGGAGAFFEIPAVRLGILYHPESIARMRASVPRPLLVRLLMLGERIAVEEAARSGVVASVVAEGHARAAAREMVRGLRGASKDAVAATKSLLIALDEGNDATAARWESVRRALLDSDDRADRLSNRGRKA